ncbi:ABC transporter ATP-binding protein [Chloroflexales bacterium ZM16-3]|nr:ABC transporter ATP-binding protein [Chloroflexales bacterium ZM16-3]
MSNYSIRAEGLSKDYLIHHAQTQLNNAQYRTLRDQIAGVASGILRGFGTLGGSGMTHSTLHAINDVSFDITHGEVVGIIGRNGAGKSTLLKVLSRITAPTRGRATIYGRMASLLEVGTGFHPELSGRENVYLNGAILGMHKHEIDRKFDEIVAFAEVEKFLDTPVKFYSSGMYVRLAFAVAAHLEPDILIIDEVLAVGDARFQRKCLNKMQDVGAQGRTVLFVSHSMSAIMRMCQRTILLDSGKVLADGPSDQVVSDYLSGGSSSTAERIWDDPAQSPGAEVARLRAARICGPDGNVSESIDIRQPVSLEMEYDVLRDGFVLMPNMHLYNDQGTHLFTTIDVDPEWRHRQRPAGRWVSRAQIPGNLLAEGTHFVNVSMITNDPVIPQFHEREAVAFQVYDTMDGDSARGDYGSQMGGVVRPMLKWENRRISTKL